MTLVKAEQGVNPAATWFATHNIASTSTAYVGSGVGIIANPGATVTGFAIASQTGAGTLGGAVNFTYE
jgi:hypothetical protein